MSRLHARPRAARIDTVATRRRAHGFRRGLRIALLVILATAVVLGVLAWTRLAAFNDRVSTTGAVGSDLAGGLTLGDERINILIIGYGGDDHAGGFLSDSINVASIDPASDTTTIIPIPRDLWIEGNPAIPANGKVNEAFAIGVTQGGVDAGGDRAAAVVSSVTGLEIADWLALDFTGFAAMVDAVGGVTIVNPVAFRYGGPDAAAGAGWDGAFAAGELHLDGEAALLYARTRYTDTAEESSDFARSVRQQRILSALVRRLTEGGPSALPALLAVMDAADDHLRTNMSVIDLGLFGLNADADRRVELAEDEILQATTTTDGQYVLVVIGRSGPSDYEPLRAFIRDRLAAPIEEPTDTASG